MKILIAADMEGISGVTHWDQVTPGHFEYPRYRQIMTEEVNAAIDGAFEGGATEVQVTDGHASGTNILIEALDRRARLNAGNGSTLGMVAGVDENVDGVLFVGYHASAGSRHAILDHTWSSKTVSGVWLNDTYIGETGLNAAVCGYFNVPVLLVTGDQTVCGEARYLLGDIEVAVVKQARERMSADCLPLAVTRKMVCEAAARAVNRLKSGQAPSPFQPDAPIHLRVELLAAEMADRAELLPNVQRLSGRGLELSAPDILSIYSSFRAIVALARP